jgi:hypothetical protein
LPPQKNTGQAAKANEGLVPIPPEALPRRPRDW